ncbi:hypothetical protein NAPIS_ORF00633 [Vairimorpha apis BRL 01]|uniref:Uncharacterized protein n=1 Tax=Vairimorpha apis BRL 01 TaxID=1037528 RepID=T0LBX3_9MICR|nr:hypothetical protein NAPIS_ORF00633 [Vairimorpha apis BRL 01]
MNEMEQQFEKIFKNSLIQLVAQLLRFQSAIKEIDSVLSKTISKQNFNKNNSQNNYFLEKLDKFSKKIKLFSNVLDKVTNSCLNKQEFYLIEYKNKNLLKDLIFYSKLYKEYVGNIKLELEQLDRIQNNSGGNYRFETKNSTIKNLLVDFKYHIDEMETIYYLYDASKDKTDECIIL